MLANAPATSVLRPGAHDPTPKFARHPNWRSKIIDFSVQKGKLRKNEIRRFIVYSFFLFFGFCLIGS